MKAYRSALSLAPALVAVFALAAWTIAGCEADHEDHAEETPEAVHTDEHGDEHGDEHAGVVALNAAQLAEFGVTIDTAAGGVLPVRLALAGEVVFDPDRVAHVVPRAPGVVKDVRRRIGDRVRAGETLAVIESRELGAAKAAYLAAVSREEVARANAERERTLRAQNISSEQDYLAAQQAMTEAAIERRLREQELHALGVSESAVTALGDQPDDQLTRYAVRAPFAGTIVERHAAIGEVVGGDAAIFTIADLGTVWIELAVYPKDLAIIRRGQRVAIAGGPGEREVSGTIEFVSPSLDEETRAATARVVLRGAGETFRPGRFVTGHVEIDAAPARVVVPATALQTVEGRTVAFVETPEGFAARPVTVGRRSATHVEITKGLAPGERYASAGTFALKAELAKASFSGDVHGH